MDLTQNGLRVTGTWNAKTGINVSAGADSEAAAAGQEFDLRNMSFVVITSLVSTRLSLRRRSTFSELPNIMTCMCCDLRRRNRTAW